MDISSEEETSLDKFILVNKNDQSHQFKEAFFKAFKNEKNDKYYDHEINTESIFLNSQEKKDNLFIEQKETSQLIISQNAQKLENIPSNSTKENEFKLFNKWSDNYNNFEKYSKDCIYELNSGPRKRVDMPDTKRKKINTNLYRNIIKYLNKKLSECLKEGKSFKFSTLSQYIIANVAKLDNKKRMNMSLKDLILDNSFINSNNKKDKDMANWKNNKKIIDYLYSTKDYLEIKQILEMKMKDIFNEYLNSDEFQKSIEELKQDGRYYEYIRGYIKVASNFIDYYS
jgi:hypothetical protein